jgi:hypothetical protein
MRRLVMGKQKDKKQDPFIAMNMPRRNPQLIEQDLKYYHWVMFIHVMEFLKQHASLRKSLLEHYFTNLLKIYRTKTWSCYVDY